VRGHHHRLAGERVERLAQLGRTRSITLPGGSRSGTRFSGRSRRESSEGRRSSLPPRQPRHRDRIAGDPPGELRRDEVLRIDHRGRMHERLRRLLADPFQPRRRMECVVVRGLGQTFRIDRVRAAISCARASRAVIAPASELPSASSTTGVRVTPVIAIASAALKAASSSR
jgi:hypothetical protein